MNLPLLSETDFEQGNSRVRGKAVRDYQMADLTWLRVGGIAEMVFQPVDEEDLIAFLESMPPEVPIYPCGLGSNILVRDGGIPGVVLRPTGKGFGNVSIEGDSRIRAGVAVPDRKLASEASNAGIGGFAFYAGIPGGVGGALRMNAGAHGTETADRLVEARMVNRSGKVVTLDCAAMKFEYRSSAAPSDCIFTSALFEGQPEDSQKIQAEMEEVKRHREQSQPIRERTGGSTFKNPEGHSAWKLIEKAGCRGLSIGGAMVSEMHCNFLINTGTATATDMEKLGETVRARVLADSGIRLEWEIKRIGLFPADTEILEFAEYCS